MATVNILTLTHSRCINTQKNLHLIREVNNLLHYMSWMTLQMYHLWSSAIPSFSSHYCVEDSGFITSTKSVPFPRPGVTECFDLPCSGLTQLPTSNMSAPNLTQLSTLLSSTSVVRGSIHTSRSICLGSNGSWFKSWPSYLVVLWLDMKSC